MVLSQCTNLAIGDAGGSRPTNETANRRFPADTCYEGVAMIRNGGFAAFRRNEHGQDLVEYSLLLGFLALTTIAIITSVANAAHNVWNTTTTDLNSASGAVS